MSICGNKSIVNQAYNKALQRIGNSWHLFGIASLAKKSPTVTNVSANKSAPVAGN
jgi:hypothetical protein